MRRKNFKRWQDLTPKAKIGVILYAALLVIGATLWQWFAGDPVSAGVVAFAMAAPAIPFRQSEATRFKILETAQYPVTAVASVHGPATARFNLKKNVPNSYITKLYVRVFGDIVKAGAGVGAATGRENPEGIIRAIRLKTSPDFGMSVKRDLTARAHINQGMFDRGFALRTADITDAAATVQVDFNYELELGSLARRRKAPYEFALPMIAFSEVTLEVECGGRDQLFTGGVNTWNLSGLNIQIAADIAENLEGVGAFHMAEEFEVDVPILQTRRDLPVELDAGYIYESILVQAERDDVVDDTLVNDIAVESGGREWLSRGDLNADNAVGSGTGTGWIRRMNQTEVLPTEVLTGLYFLNLMPDGMASRGVNALKDKLTLKFDVTLGAGTVRNLRLRVRRFKPIYLRMPNAA